MPAQTRPPVMQLVQEILSVHATALVGVNSVIVLIIIAALRRLMPKNVLMKPVTMLARTWLPAMHLVKELWYVRRRASTAVLLEIVLRVIVAQYQCMQKNDLIKHVTMLAQIWLPAMQLVKEILPVRRWGGTRVPLEIVQVTIVARCRLLKAV